jgi:hypothetical protein
MTVTSVESFNSQPQTIEHLNPIAAQMMLDAFPNHIQEAFKRRAKEIDYP